MKNLTNTSVTNSKKMLGLENYVKIIRELQNSGLIKDIKIFLKSPS